VHLNESGHQIATTGKSVFSAHGADITQQTGADCQHLQSAARFLMKYWHISTVNVCRQSASSWHEFFTYSTQSASRYQTTDKMHAQKLSIARMDCS
jgi:hypothetical protein